MAINTNSQHKLENIFKNTPNFNFILGRNNKNKT